MTAAEKSRLSTAVSNAAQVIDPSGELEDVSLMAGLVAYAIAHAETFVGFDDDTVAAAIRWNWPDNPGYQEEMIDLVHGRVG